MVSDICVCVFVIVIVIVIVVGMVDRVVSPVHHSTRGSWNLDLGGFNEIAETTFS
jgi:hypothetical protein